MKKTVALFAALSAAAGIATMTATIPLLRSGAYQSSDLIGYSSMAVSALLVFFGIRHYRSSTGSERLGFGRAFAVGLLITLVSAACQVVAFQLVYFWIVPDFGELFAHCMVERARVDGAPPERIAETARTAATLKRLYDQPLGNAALTFAQPLPIGIVAAALSAVVLRRTRPGRP
jgi:hypothetical protein